MMRSAWPTFVPTLAAALAALALSSPASAATVVRVATVSVADVVPGKFGFTGGQQDIPPFAPMAPFTLAVGDTLDFTVDFAGSETLTIDNLNNMWALVYATSGGAQSTHMTGSMDLLDAAGGVLFSTSPRASDEAQIHIGQTFSFFEFTGGLPASVTIGGVRWVGTVNSYTPYALGTDPVITSRDFASPGLYFNADSFTASVPEPASALLLLAGATLLGALSRRRQG